MRAKVVCTCLVLIWMMPSVLAEKEFPISLTCTNCHQDRYNEWSHSMHALSVSDPIFEAAYLRAYESDPKFRVFCLSCHSPTTRLTGDFNLSKSISIEGITCSFCHSVTAVEGNNFSFSPDNPMLGPYNDSKTDAHASSYSALHTTSEFCAGCHEFSINGVPISQTYSEWKASPDAAEGKQCQDCHMETKSGVAATNGPVRGKVYQHFWYGGHTGLFLQNAFRIATSIQRTGNRVNVTLNITNNNVGHMIPSGLPMRKVVLDFNATDEQGHVLYSAEKVYAKTLLDQYGNEATDFWNAVSIAKDNRFKPEESRMETFEFDVPNGTGRVDIQATLTYQLQAEIITTEMESLNAELARASNSSVFNSTTTSLTPKAPDVGWVGFFIAMTVAVLVIRRIR